MLYRYGESDLNFGGWLFKRKSSKKSKKKSKKRKSRRRTRRRTRRRSSFGRRRRSRRRSRPVRKGGKKAVTMVIVDPYEGLVKIQGKLIQLPTDLLDDLQDATGKVMKVNRKIKVLDPAKGVFDVAGEVVNLPFNLSKSVLRGSKLKSSRRSKKRSKRRKSFGSFGGGRPSTLLGMEGPYM